LATILMKQGKLDLAIAEYERILAQLPDPRVAHRKLADMYKQLDQPSLAKLHEDKAK
jgi:predicted Zn-dependent protease